ncbi:gasdermin-A isoform X2 [Struthio camelus]|uniref:gasdermin-A isoform X2 n=1 Tax=Struthio camelus TaxID=8801 RepID=UPI00051E4CEC|nr:PREDICTED: gasdermin-A isoform X2 [Struthio camelus australis]
MFKKVTQTIAKQMDPKGELIPVYSILDQEHFRPLCLVRRKGKTIFRPTPGYLRTEYSLYDVLLLGEDKTSTELLIPAEDVQDSSQVTFTHHVDGRVEGKLHLPVNSANTEVSTRWSKEGSIKLEKKSIPVAKLESLKTERKINMNHSFIKQLKKKQQNLYVVHESIQASEETNYEEYNKTEGSFMAQLYAKFSTQGSRGCKHSITIPKGCTIAFRTMQLTIEDGSWCIHHFPEENIQTFVSDGIHHFREDNIQVFESDGFSHGKLGALEKEVKAKYQIFSMLSVDLYATFLKSIKAVMRNRNLFQELTQKVEAVLDETDNCELKTESPDLKDLLHTLQDTPGDLLLKLAGAINYTLYALDELTEDQLLLLLESLEEDIVFQQLKLVKSILGHDIQDMEGCFSMDASLLSFSQEKEQKLTTAMLEMSGVKIQKNGSAEYKQEAFSSLAALYASLYVLDLLSKSD